MQSDGQSIGVSKAQKLKNELTNEPHAMLGYINCLAI